MNTDVVRHVRVWHNGEVVSHEIAPDRIAAEIADPRTLVWVDLVDPSEEELARLGANLGLRPEDLEDTKAPHERPKAVRRGDRAFFQTYATRLDIADVGGVDSDVDLADLHIEDGGLELSRISAFVLPQALLTVRLDERFDMTDVVARWQGAPELVAEGPNGLVHGLLDAVVDGHFATIQQLDDVLEDLEDLLFEQSRTGHDFLRMVYGVRKDLVRLRRVVLPMREVVNALERHRPTGRTELDAAFADLYDHVLRAAEWTESLRDMVTSVFETNLSLQDARLNVVMKKLAGWAAILAVPTAITGWFGQNVPYPGFSAVSGFWASLGSIVVITAALFIAFRRWDWL